MDPNFNSLMKYDFKAVGVLQGQKSPLGMQVPFPKFF